MQLLIYVLLPFTFIQRFTEKEESFRCQALKKKKRRLAFGLGSDDAFLTQNPRNLIGLIFLDGFSFVHML